MTTFIIIIIFFIFVLLCYSIYSFYWIKELKLKNDNKQKDAEGETMNWKAISLIIVATLLIIISFISPYIFTRTAINNDFDFRSTGQIGDTIGGLMNPFITLAGVIVTGLAFYIQYEANRQQKRLFNQQQIDSNNSLQKQIDSQKEQLEQQQFESRFYEMVRLHRDNISEMNITGYDFTEQPNALHIDGENTSDIRTRSEKITKSRKCFVTMHRELEAIISIYIKVNGNLTQAGFNVCYKIFFGGLDQFALTNPNENELITKLQNARYQHENIIYAKTRKVFEEDVKLYFNYKPFSGHSSRLGHYFRHLYLTVKSIVNEPIADTYDKKMKYLTLLRAQLSNHEQILLFYNWLGEFGENWEDETNAFFTEYCMIHNLWYTELNRDPYITNHVNLLRVKPVKFRKKRMFEIDD
jgi:heme/copper-type cytochrome/quinol oxidase subunit 2